MSSKKEKVVKVAEVKVAGKRGRPVIEGSKRQLREAAKAEKIARGETIKAGRPKGTTKPVAEKKVKVAKEKAAPKAKVTKTPKAEVETVSETSETVNA